MGPNLLLPPVVLPTQHLGSTSLVAFRTHLSRPVFCVGAGRPSPSVLDHEIPFSLCSRHGALSCSMSLRLPNPSHRAFVS